MTKAFAFVRREAVLFVSLIAAAASMLFVPPDAEYLGYVDFDVLMLLFSLMTVVSALKLTGAFAAVSRVLTRRSRSARGLGTLLTLGCFFSSMLVTNDVTLMTFVPLTITLLGSMPATLIYVVALETVAANLGSMATPIGNPQNLYLYAHYAMPPRDFLAAVMPIAAASLILVLVCCALIKKRDIAPPDVEAAATVGPSAFACAVCAAQFICCLLSVFKVLPVYAGFAFVAVTAAIFMPRALAHVDYGLLATFACFFVFVGNLGRVSAVRDMITAVISARELEVGILASQVISNVPAALMLSGFTGDAAALMRGVDIGGLGTLVASLASLISFKLYAGAPNARVWKYLKIFTIVNLAFLAALYALARLL